MREWSFQLMQLFRATTSPDVRREGIELHCMVHILPSLTIGEAWSLCERVQEDLASDGCRMLVRSSIDSLAEALDGLFDIPAGRL